MTLPLQARRLLIACALAWACLSTDLPALQPAAPAADAEGWLRLASAHAVRYQHDLSSFVADETYTQQVLVGRAERRRRTRADLLVMQATGGLRWVAFRSVYELDGRPVGDREARITRLFAGAADGQVAAAALLTESARFNIGSVTRTVNGPTFALAYLDASAGPRLRAVRHVVGRRDVRVDFVEAARPTLTQGSGQRDLPAAGSVWLSLDGTKLLRTELKWQVPPDPSKRFPTAVTVRVDYHADPRFGSLVPLAMHEQYIGEKERIWCTARYANVRRFSVETGESGPPGP